MKTKLLSVFGTVGAVMLTMAVAPNANAQGDRSNNEKNYSGTIANVDTRDNIVTVRGFLSDKNYVLAHDCKLETSDNTSASLTDFRPGEKIAVRYVDASGVLVADQIKAEKMCFTGTVQVIDLPNHTLTVHHRGMNHTFTIADNCLILGNGDKKESLDNVKWGDRVSVVYELPGDKRVARQIDLPGMVYTGALSAINLDDHSIAAGKGQRFFLANDCVIIANGNYNARMNDLRMGLNYQINYETVGGVNVVNRIAPAESQPKTSQPVHTAQTMPPL